MQTFPHLGKKMLSIKKNLDGVGDQIFKHTADTFQVLNFTFSSRSA